MSTVIKNTMAGRSVMLKNNLQGSLYSAQRYLARKSSQDIFKMMVAIGKKPAPGNHESSLKS